VHVSHINEVEKINREIFEGLRKIEESLNSVFKYYVRDLYNFVSIGLSIEQKVEVLRSMIPENLANEAWWEYIHGLCLLRYLATIV
jgi:hypothetical protein